MIVSTTRQDHTLEISGPRNQGWSPASSMHHEILRSAIRLAKFGQLAEAIDTAELAWIAEHQHMHGVRFRVRSTLVALTGVSPQDVTDGA